MSNDEIPKIMKILEEHEKKISKLETLLQSRSEIDKKIISIKEFLLSKRPKNDVQKALVIAYYLENYENYSSFNVKDIKEGFRTAKEKIPSNIGDKIYLNVKKGHMMETKEKKDNLKSWVITNLGERLVKYGFKKL